MAKQFDPYYEWLGIPPKDQPPNHYRLLGLELFEVNRNVIAAAAIRQMSFIKEYEAGKHSDLSQGLLNELAAARLCLLNEEQKAGYDNELRARLKAKKMPPVRPPPLAQGREADGASGGNRATRKIEGRLLSVPMKPPLALEPALPPAIENRSPAPAVGSPASPRASAYLTSLAARIVALVEPGAQSRAKAVVVGIAAGLAFAVFAVLLALWTASLLEPPRSPEHPWAPSGRPAETAYY